MSGSTPSCPSQTYYSGYPPQGFIAVGSAGTVVRNDGQTWQLGYAELRDIHRELRIGPSPALLFVVGDAGTLVVGRELDWHWDSYADIQWFVQWPVTTANLHAITMFDGNLIVVGDDVVLVGREYGVEGVYDWTAEPPPPGGWGQLRDIEVVALDEHPGEIWVRAAGLEGRIWTADSLAEGWLAIDAGTDEDLIDVTHRFICGTGGTIVTCETLKSCSSSKQGEADFVACNDNNAEIDADRWVHSWAGSHQFDWQARGIDEYSSMVVVGDGGHAAYVLPPPFVD